MKSEWPHLRDLYVKLPENPERVSSSIVKPGSFPALRRFALHFCSGQYPIFELNEWESQVRFWHGSITVLEFKKVFRLKIIPGEKQGNFHTLGGFVITHLGKIPKATDSFNWKGLKFEVMDMDGNRVDKVLVMPISQPLFNQTTNDIY